MELISGKLKILPPQPTSLHMKWVQENQYANLKQSFKFAFNRNIVRIRKLVKNKGFKDGRNFGFGCRGNGQCFQCAAGDCGHKINLIGTHLDTDLIRGILRDGIHEKLKVKLQDRIVASSHDQLGEVLSDNTDLIVYGVNSAGVRWANQQLGRLLKKSTPILMLTKGLAVRNNAIRILPQIVRQELLDFGLSDIPVAAVAARASRRTGSAS